MSGPPDSIPPDTTSKGGNLFSDLVLDQKAIWASPAAIRKTDLKWVVPFAVGTSLLIWRDSTIMSRYNPSAQTVNAGNNVSVLGSGYVTSALVLGQFAIGALAHKERLRKSGLLGIEALIDSTIVVTSIKYATNRERPLEGDRDGSFWGRRPIVSFGSRDFQLDCCLGLCRRLSR